MIICISVSGNDFRVGWWVGLNFDCNEWDSNDSDLEWCVFINSFNEKFLGGLGFL